MNKTVMTPEEKQTWFADYMKGVHRQGIAWSVWNVALLLAVPFLMGLALDAMPDMNVFWKGFSMWPSSTTPPAWWNT